METDTTIALNAAEQLRDGLASTAETLAAVVPIFNPRSETELAKAIAESADLTMSALKQPDSQRERAITVAAVMAAIWGRSDPPPDWWMSPLGRLCAESMTAEWDGSWTHAFAASVLGVHRGTVAKQVSRGRLETHPGGGVVIAAVVAYGRDRRRLDRAESMETKACRSNNDGN